MFFLTMFLSALCNTSLRTEVVPASLKTAVVTSLMKKSFMGVNTLQNYRPISTLSFVSKLLERLVNTQLQPHVVTHSLLPPHQSAYRRGHSTETALLKVYSDLVSALDSSSDNQFVLAVLDMTAVLDTVDHSILLRRLERSYGVSSSAMPCPIETSMSGSETKTIVMLSCTIWRFSRIHPRTVAVST